MTTSVLVTRQPDNRYTARALALPDVVASGDTEREAVDQLRVILATLQEHSRVVEVDLPLPTAEHLWRRFAGMWRDDPDWPAFSAAIERNRQLEQDSSVG